MLVAMSSIGANSTALNHFRHRISTYVQPGSSPSPSSLPQRTLELSGTAGDRRESRVLEFGRFLALESTDGPTLYPRLNGMIVDNIDFIQFALIQLVGAYRLLARGASQRASPFEKVPGSGCLICLVLIVLAAWSEPGDRRTRRQRRLARPCVARRRSSKRFGDVRVSGSDALLRDASENHCLEWFQV